jgi:Sec-independent protein secretion pathway component TatC
MMLLYEISILGARLFGRKKTDDDRNVDTHAGS